MLSVSTIDFWPVAQPEKHEFLLAPSERRGAQLKLCLSYLISSNKEYMRYFPLGYLSVIWLLQPTGCTRNTELPGPPAVLAINRIKVLNCIFSEFTFSKNCCTGGQTTTINIFTALPPYVHHVEGKNTKKQKLLSMLPVELTKWQGS